MSLGAAKHNFIRQVHGIDLWTGECVPWLSFYNIYAIYALQKLKKFMNMPKPRCFGATSFNWKWRYRRFWLLTEVKQQDWPKIFFIVENILLFL